MCSAITQPPFCVSSAMLHLLYAYHGISCHEFVWLALSELGEYFSSLFADSPSANAR
jgi:hypothetical protein